MTPSSFVGFASHRLPLIVKAASLAVIVMTALMLAAGWWQKRDVITLGLDWLGYRAGFDRFLSTGLPYAEFQLAGPFTPVHLDFIHPPSFLFLAGPFAVLPQPLDYVFWIATPLMLVLALYRRLPWWAWPIAAFLVTTDSFQYPVLNGNSSLWMGAAFAWALRIGWPAGLIAMKPSLILLAFPGIKRPLPALALASVPILLTLPLWPSYMTVLANASLPWTYSATQWALVGFVALPWFVERVVPLIRDRSTTIRSRARSAGSASRPNATRGA